MRDTNIIESEPKATPFEGTEEPTIENGGLGEGPRDETPTQAIGPEAKIDNETKTIKLPTAKEFKQWRRLHFTVRCPIVRGCSHKLNTDADPRNNCPMCWFAFFNHHGEMVQTADEVFTKYGPEAVSALRGKKFMKNFIKFMATLAVLQKQQEAVEATINTEQNVESTGLTESSTSSEGSNCDSTQN